MGYPITDIEGIDAEALCKLKALGIRTTDSLLEAAKDAKGRKRLAASTGLSELDLLAWANMADQMRIRGLGKDYVPLLRDAGVRTVRALKHRNAPRLAAAIAKANASRRKPVKILPSEGAVQRWIDEADVIQLKISY